MRRERPPEPDPATSGDVAAGLAQLFDLGVDPVDRGIQPPQLERRLSERGLQITGATVEQMQPVTMRLRTGLIS
jgi:hypothetical protein